MDDERLHQWASRREQRLRPAGARRVVTLAAAHVDPTVPRLLGEISASIDCFVITVRRPSVRRAFNQPS
ncbi:DUF6087 family protein [Kitasatospora sp. NPDC056138]|uniref:DUF6087 family protein n=1 Tax=Kitasatospora sp. NPDC056138 TaxID=3345724 RepID=UPI0035D75614